MPGDACVCECPNVLVGSGMAGHTRIGNGRSAASITASVHQSRVHAQFEAAEERRQG